MVWTKLEVEKAIDIIRNLASKDAEFRRLCLTDPNEAIRKVTGKEVPDGYRVKLIENQPGYDSTFVLPDLIRSELSDEELDRVAGGRGGCDRDGYCDVHCEHTRK